MNKPEQIPLAPYQLRYATIGIPYGVTAEPEFSYEINDEDKHISINAGIEICDGIDIQTYFDEEIAKLRQDNKIVNITKQETETIDGNKALVLHIDHKTNENFSSMEFTEYVGILCKTFCVLFKAWGFLKLFTPGEHLWQAMYRSFRSDDSQPYKLPFGSFILPKEAEDYTTVDLFSPNKKKEEDDDDNDESEDEEYEDDYTFTISYANNIEEVKKHIPNFSRIVLSIFLGALIVVKQDKIIRLGSKKGRYFEARVTIGGDTIAVAFFHALEGLKPGLEIEIGSNNPKTFERYRPQMEAILRSITFDETAAGGEE